MPCLDIAQFGLHEMSVLMQDFREQVSQSPLNLHKVGQSDGSATESTVQGESFGPCV